MKNFLVLGVLVVQLCLLAGVQASEVRDSLDAYEWTIDDKVVDRLPASARAELLAIATDDSEPSFIRQRASATLVYFPDESVWQFFVQELDKPANKVFRRRAVENLCAAFASLKPEAVAELVGSLVQEEDVHLRISAAKCLGELSLVGSGGQSDAHLEKVQSLLQEYAELPLPAWERRASGLSIQSNTGVSTTDSSGLSTEASSGLSTEASSGLFTEDSSGLSTTDGSGLSTEASSGLSTTDGSGLSTEDSSGLSN